MQFTTLLAATIAAVSLVVGATPAPNTNGGIVSLAEMKAWVDAQPAGSVTLIDDPFGALEPRAAESVTVTFCSTVSGTVCTGPCNVVTGSGICISAPDTNCLFATGQVSFCDRSGCGGSCNEFDSCGTRLTNNFCDTPGTASIGIPAGS